MANFLTYGNVHCLHDGLHGCSSFGQFRNKLVALPAKVVGNSDSGLGFVWHGLAPHFPGYKTVFVWRDMEEAMASFIGFYSEFNFSEKKARAVFEELYGELHRWRDSRENGDCFDVNFESLERKDTAQLIWQFLTDEPFNHARWELLNRLRVNPASEKFSILPEKFAALRNENLVSSGAA